MEAISNYSGPKLVITKKRKKDTDENSISDEQNSEDHYNADLDPDSTESTEVSVKIVEKEIKITQRVKIINIMV